MTRLRHAATFSVQALSGSKPFRRTAMHSICLKPNCFWIALSAGLCFAMPALAMDPTCQALMQSQIKIANTPVHITLTETRTWSNTLARAAAGMGMGGTKRSEEISTGKAVYVLHGGTWINMQTSFAEMGKLGDPNDPDIKKAQETKRCQALPDETVAGQTAAVYQEHNPESGIDAKVWISKSTHLPLKSETTNKAAGSAMTSVTISTYDYNNVRAPAGAITMKQMVDERRR